MPHSERAVAVAQQLWLGLSVLVRQVRQTRDPSLSLPETTALKRLENEPSVTLAALARAEAISPQSLGATVAALAARGLISREPDPDDARQTLLAITPAGRALLHDRHSARVRQFAVVLERDFTEAERETLAAAAPLLERLGTAL